MILNSMHVETLIKLSSKASNSSIHHQSSTERWLLSLCQVVQNTLKMSNTERKEPVSKASFIVALVAHTVKNENDRLFAYSNKWLYSETVATILCSMYNLNGPTFITEVELNRALSSHKIELHREFGIAGIHSDSFHFNFDRIYRHVYQVNGINQWFYYISENGSNTVQAQSSTIIHEGNTRRSSGRKRAKVEVNVPLVNQPICTEEWFHGRLNYHNAVVKKVSQKSFGMNSGIPESLKMLKYYEMEIIKQHKKE